MVGVKSPEVERKVLAILKIINESHEPVGARVISRRLNDYGVNLTERAVRYHLKLTDEQGLTRLVGWDGRLVTERGIEEISNALVWDKVELLHDRIETQALRTTFDWKIKAGLVPVNVSFFPKEGFKEALVAMAPAFVSGFGIGNRVVVKGEGEQIGEFTVPQGKVGFGTAGSILLNGVLLKSAIPVDSHFSGLLQIRDRKPLRFIELIHYGGSSLDPNEIFIRGRMTSVTHAAGQGNGYILASFHEVPAVCGATVEQAVNGLKGAGLGMVLATGHNAETLCGVTVGLNKIGLILADGLNPVAAAEETGITAEKKALSTVIDYKAFVIFDSLLM